MEFTYTSFSNLTPQLLYEILALRSRVFVVEQNCVYQDMDGLDIHAHHVYMKENHGKVIAYSRLLPPGKPYTGYASIGRIVTSPIVRGQGRGRQLVQESIDLAEQIYPQKPIKIMAQSHLQNFYREFGFTPVGDEFLEDGIPHVYMLKSA